MNSLYRSMILLRRDRKVAVEKTRISWINGRVCDQLITQGQGLVALVKLVQSLAATFRQHYDVVVSIQITGEKKRAASAPHQNRRDPFHRQDIVVPKLLDFLRNEAP